MQRAAGNAGVAQEFKSIFELGGVPAFNQYYVFGIFIWKGYSHADSANGGNSFY